MMGDRKMINEMILQGRLTADPEIKETQSGVKYCNFTVAWSEKYKETERKCFLRCKAWRNTAEFLGKYFKKGSELILEGTLITEKWEENNVKKSRTVCQVDKINFCGKKLETGMTETGADVKEEPESNEEYNDFSALDDIIDDLPFK